MLKGSGIVADLSYMQQAKQYREQQRKPKIGDGLYRIFLRVGDVGVRNIFFYNKRKNKMI